MDEKSEYMTRQEAADYLGISTRTVDSYAAKFELAKYKRLNRVYLLRKDVEAIGGYSLWAKDLP